MRIRWQDDGGTAARNAKVPSMKRIVCVCSIAVAFAFALMPAVAQDNTTRIRGTIVSFEGNVLTVSASGENRRITLASYPNIVWLLKSELSTITPGMFVGGATTTQPDGTLRAVEVRVSRPYDLFAQSSMANGTAGANAQVESVGDHVLTIKYKDGEKKIIVSKNTPVVLYEFTGTKALVLGAHVYVIATRGANRTLSSVRVNVGKDGVVPPM